ncbi:MAG: glycosyltransferase family 4 protein [Terriglobia bacterium]
MAALTEVFHRKGGIPAFNRALVRALADFGRATGARTCVLSLNDSPADVDSRYTDPAAVRFQGYGRRKRRFALGFLRAVLSSPELVILGHVNLLPLAWPLALRGSPYLLVAHGTEAWQRLPGGGRRLLAHARTVLAVSNYTREKLARQNGLSPAAWRVFPDTLDPFFLPAPEAPASPSTLLSVCRLDAQERGKGVDTVLRALPALCRLLPDLRYVVVGAGSDRPRLEGLARELGVARAVQFTGLLSRSELSQRYSAASVFVLPSTQEGFGIVYLEAMAHAKPVVAARFAAVPEVVDDGATGLLIEPGNVPALEAALEQLLRHADLRRRMGAAGRRRLAAHFTFDLFRRRLARLLVELCPRAAYLAKRRSLLSPAPSAPAQATASDFDQHSLPPLSQDRWEKKPIGS